LTAPTSNLDWFKWNIPRGTEFRTGTTLDASSNSWSISAPTNAMLFINEFEFVVETGSTWSTVSITFPAGNGDVIGDKSMSGSGTGESTLAQIADQIVKYNAGDGKYYLYGSGIVFYGYKFDLGVPIKLRWSKSDSFSVQFTGLSKRIDVKVKGWTINESNAGFSD